MPALSELISAPADTGQAKNDPVADALKIETQDIAQQGDPDPAQDDPPTPSEAERIAAYFGWKPEADWKGDKSGWTDAETYLKTVPKYIGRLQEHNRQSRREVDEMRSRFSNVERTINHFRDREIASVRSEYENAKYKAAEAGDQELFDRLSKEQQEIEEKAAPQRQQPQDWDQTARDILNHPAARRFYTTHSWILQDGNEEAFDLVAHAAQMVADRGGTPAQQMRAAEEELVYAYPEFYRRQSSPQRDQRDPREQRQEQAPQRDQARDPDTGRFVQEVQNQRRAPPPISNGQRTPVKGDVVGSLVARLPSEARAAMDAEVKRGHSPESWLKIFHRTNDLSQVQ